MTEQFRYTPDSINGDQLYFVFASSVVVCICISRNPTPKDDRRPHISCLFKDPLTKDCSRCHLIHLNRDQLDLITHALHVLHHVSMARGKQSGHYLLRAWVHVVHERYVEPMQIFTVQKSCKSYNG
ncbi:hypothetical protein TNCV_3155211 [Trichonephila clavipes]|nr:hypothetical protein TNCV_3155211 [Trichonephila clavipes]